MPTATIERPSARTKSTSSASPWLGIFSARVCDVKDPDNMGRVKISLRAVPDPQGEQYTCWARVATLMAGNDRGTWFVPDVDDEVLVAFENGDPRCPCVLGSLWNGQNTPPRTMDGAGSNNQRVLRSRNGLQITLDDTPGEESLVLETPGGQKLTLKDGPGRLRLDDSNGNVVELTSAGVSVVASSKVTVTASTVAISAGMVSVDAGMARFSGVVQADTLIANSVIGASYTPGAGNIF